MPFVTEALWAAIPHRASDPPLLIVARWPGVGERDPLVEAATEELIELVTMIRNARASAHLPAGAMLETWVSLPPDIGPAFETLRPAIERLARARPLHRVLTPEALDGVTLAGDLRVVAPAGDLEAAIRPSGADAEAEDLERARLEKELGEAEGHLRATLARLANPSFMDKAPPAVVDGAQMRAAELTDQVARLRDRLGR
jgi:valyl-tRNA synthetase